MKRFIVSTCVLVLSVLFVKAQYAPEFPVLVVKEDYAKSEPLFLQATQWLNETDLGTQEELRQRTQKFVLDWINGSPTVRLNLTEMLAKLFLPDNPALLMIYMANYSSFCIQHPDNKSETAAGKAALQAVSVVYKKGLGIKKNKFLKKMVESIDEGQLDRFLQDQKHPPYRS